MKTAYNISYLLIISLLVITGCFKEDKRVPQHIPAEGKSITIALESEYKYRSWFQLSSANEMHRELKTEYDLEFENGTSGWRIYLNTALFMKVAETHQTDPIKVTDTVGVKWKFDSSDGSFSGNSFGIWVDTLSGLSDQQVRIIDRGIDLKGRSRGFYKVIIDSVTPENYHLRFGLLKSNEMKTLVISKTNKEESVRLLLDENSPIIMPSVEENSYDLLFGQYTTLLYTSEGAPYPYLVTGVLINQQQIEVAVDSIIGYNNINLNTAQSMQYSKRKDIIGYNWKQTVGDVTTGNVSYIIRDGITYVIKHKDGLYYKMQFFKFYNDKGDKGYPAFLLAPL